MVANAIAVDGDGVLVDYRKIFPEVWRTAFGSEIEMVSPHGL